MYLWIRRIFKYTKDGSENLKYVNRKQILGQLVANPQPATFAEDPLTLEFIKSVNLRICDLRNLIATAHLCEYMSV
jgi:hypothetical protein